MAGVGSNLADQFSDQWWSHVFNKAAAKISVQSRNGSVQVTSEQLLSEDKKAKLKEKILYGNFIKVRNKYSLLQLNFPTEVFLSM